MAQHRFSISITFSALLFFYCKIVLNIGANRLIFAKFLCSDHDNIYFAKIRYDNYSCLQERYTDYISSIFKLFDNTFALCYVV